MPRFLSFLLACGLVLSACATPNPAPDAESTSSARPTSPQPEANQCSGIAVNPTPDAGVDSIFPPTVSYEKADGPAEAPVTLIVYNDFQCPTCASLAISLKQLKAKHGDALRLVYRPFPLMTVHDKTAQAARAAEAAEAQGQFWQMHNLLFEKQNEWVQLSPTDFDAWLKNQSAALGLDQTAFDQARNSAETAKIVEDAWKTGQKMGLPGAPLMLINGQIYTGPRDFSSMDYITSLIALGRRQFTTCPEVVIRPNRQYTATLKTEKGDIVIRLFVDTAPKAVNNFIFLARAGWYDNITFHRVLPGFMAQTGDPSGTGAGNPGYFIDDEINFIRAFEGPGMVAMANSGRDTNGSQFFITLAPAPQMDGDYTIFGEVISGLDVVRQLTPRDAIPGLILPDGDKLITITIEEQAP